MRAQLFLSIQDSLKEIKGNDGLPVFKHFDLWNRQVAFIEKETPFPFPAIFVEFLPIQWETHGQRVQRADMFVRLHIVTQWFSQTGSYSPDQENALTYLDLSGLVHKQLQGNPILLTNGWMRTQSIINHDHETIVDSIEEYKCQVVDYGAQPATVPASNITPVLTFTNPQEE